MTPQLLDDLLRPYRTWLREALARDARENRGPVLIQPSPATDRDQPQ